MRNKGLLQKTAGRPGANEAKSPASSESLRRWATIDRKRLCRRKWVVGVLRAVRVVRGQSLIRAEVLAYHPNLATEHDDHLLGCNG